MALTLHLRRPESSDARSTARDRRRAGKAAEADLDSVYQDDDYLDDHD